MSLFISPESARVFKYMTDTAGEAQRSAAPVPDGWTTRDEANVLTAFAFRNSFLESLHAGAAGFSDAEMRKLMVETSARLAQLLFLARERPGWYAVFLLEYGHMYCRGWERIERESPPPDVLRGTCSSCATDVQLSWEYCSKCGAPQRASERPESSPQTSVN